MPKRCSPQVKTKRNRANRLWGNVVRKVIAALNSEAIRTRAAEFKVDLKEAERFFEGELKECQLMETEESDGFQALFS